MAKNRKVHAIVKYFYPVAAGIETNMLETYSVLAGKDWDVTIHTSNLEYTTGEILSEGEKIRGINVKRYPLTKFSFFHNLNSKVDVIALHNFDVFPHFWILLYTYICKILGRKKYTLVLTPHGGFNPEWRVFPKITAIVKSAYHFTLGVILINASVDGVRAVSEWEKQEMIKKGLRGDKINVISNGIEDEAFVNIERKASNEMKEIVKRLGKYVIQIGRVYPIKNYETTIQAFKNVPEDVKFVIVGPISSESYKRKLDSLIRKLGLEDRVIFFGVVRGVDKYYLIKNAEMMVHMAIWESFCNVLHEGMSQGLPVIAANNTAIPYLVKDNVNGYLADTKDQSQVAEKINHILKNKHSPEIKNMSQTNIEFSKEHAWSVVAEKMDKFYKYLLTN